MESGKADPAVDPVAADQYEPTTREKRSSSFSPIIHVRSGSDATAEIPYAEYLRLTNVDRQRNSSSSVSPPASSATTTEPECAALRATFTNEVIRAVGALARQQNVCREQGGHVVFVTGMEAAREYIVEHAEAAVTAQTRQLDTLRKDEHQAIEDLTKAEAALHARDEALRALEEKWGQRADDLTNDRDVMRDDRVKARILRECKAEVSRLRTGTQDQP